LHDPHVCGDAIVKSIRSREASSGGTINRIGRSERELCPGSHRAAVTLASALEPVEQKILET